LLLPVLLLALGVAFFVAASTVFVRDMPHLTAVLIQILFFMTPIFYSIDMIPASLRWLMALNPLASMVDQVRNALLFGQWPDWGTFAWNMGLAFIVCRLGVCWFLKTKKGFADVL
ncbi:ABC transporter permease, partial [Desulfovibrio piger]